VIWALIIAFIGGALCGSIITYRLWVGAFKDIQW
jgi:hypothetical protein